LEDESVYREKEVRELEGLIDKGLKGDYGCSIGGLYELVGKWGLNIGLCWAGVDGFFFGVIVMHKGAAVDHRGCRHYIRFVKKSMFHVSKGGVVGWGDGGEFECSLN
jgi:ubiquitin carboxyl-terminal hydrolase 14